MYGSKAEAPNRYKIVAVLLVAFGIALRLGAYLVHRSLWGDEIALALNLRFRSFLALVHHLDYEQTMPIPLLMVNKAVVSIFGTSEYAFRLAALLTGCCMVLVVWPAFERLFGERVALIAVAITVICRPLIYYSAEFKQYELDALITVASLWLVWRVFEDEKHWRKLLLWGVVALLFSQPAVFLLSTAGLLAVLDARFRMSRAWRRYTIAAAITWGGTFGTLYFLSYRAVSHSAYMRAFWSYSFLYPGSSGFLRHLADAIYTLLAAQAFDFVRAGVLVALFAVGVYGIWRRYGWTATAIATFPFLEVLTAAALKQYPIAMRLVLFLLPLTFWVYATGIVTIADLLRPNFRPAATAVLAIVLLAPTTIATVRYVLHFPKRETSQRMVAYIKAIDPYAPVYIAFDEYLQWAYYGGDWNNPEAVKQKLNQAFHSSRRLEFAPDGLEKEPLEVVGEMPPSSASETSDHRWARDEATAILDLGQPRVWLFTPVYLDDAEMGHTFRQRRLLETLQAELNRGGAQLEKKYTVGESTVLLYNFPKLHASMRQPRH